MSKEDGADLLSVARVEVFEDWHEPPRPDVRPGVEERQPRDADAGERQAPEVWIVGAARIVVKR